jgi:twitching motility protein PilT
MNPPREDFDRIVASVWQHRGTDLLFTEGSPPVGRVDGELVLLEGEGTWDAAMIGALIDDLLQTDQREEFQRDLELDFSFGWRHLAHLRGNAFNQRGAPALALRMIPNQIPTFDELGLPEVVGSFAKLNQGLVLVTGPTGSGKSTTLASLIEWINRNRACHVLTIEDPIEYVHQNRKAIVSQREIGADSHSFARALRSALREDPDVLLIGEMRDPESIATALTIAETGHLVFSTLHTNDAAQALDRIVDVFPAERQAQIRVQLAGSLTGIVAQRLLPVVGGGLVAAFEVLVANQAVRNLIREGKTRQIRNAVLTGHADGMQTLEHALSALVGAGRVTYEDAVARALHPNDVVRPNAGAGGITPPAP